MDGLFPKVPVVQGYQIELKYFRHSGHILSQAGDLDTQISAQKPTEALVIGAKMETRIDLLLTDVVMPEMSGPELARRLSRERPGMKVLLMSGYAEDSIGRYGQIEARFAYIQKPLMPIPLTRKVREVLD